MGQGTVTTPATAWGCICVFKADRNPPEKWATHRIPIECRDEEYWRERSDALARLSKKWNDTDALIQRYGELLEHDATEEHKWEDWCRARSGGI